jgi:hypothetical protein
MFNYILRRTLGSIPVLLGISLVASSSFNFRPAIMVKFTNGL